jgi:transcriptional regulator with XRE-family HTH domain
MPSSPGMLDPITPADWHTHMGDFTALVRRLMDERGLTLRKLALKAGYSDHTLLSKVLNGRKPLTPYLAASLDRALAADGAVIAAAEQAMATAEAVRLPLRELADHAAELGAWAESGTVGPGTIAVLDEEVSRLIREHSSSPPGPLILRASDVCRRASGMLRQHQRLRHARDLMVVASRSCAFLAVALGDIGQQAEAAMYARTSLTLAGEAGDQHAAALALSALSKVAFWDGHRDAAAVYAMRGYELADGEGSLRVLLACQAADASPVPQAREAIDLSQSALDDAPPHQPGMFSCGRVRAVGYRATLALREGDFPGVLAAAGDSDAALAAGERASFGSVTQTRINAALACLASGDPDQAADWLTPVLTLQPEMRLATFTGKMARAAQLASAAPYDSSPAARNLADDLRGYLGHDPDPMPYPLALGPAK